MPRSIFPRPGPNPKKVNFMAPTRTDPIIFYSIWTGPCILSSTRNYPISDCNKPVNTTRNEPITSYNMLICVFHLTFEIPRRKIHDTPVKNTPTRTGSKSSSPTRPENILKNVSGSRTGFGPVQSGSGNLGFQVAPQAFTSGHACVQH